MRRAAVLALFLAALVVANPVTATAHGLNDVTFTRRKRGEVDAVGPVVLEL